MHRWVYFADKTLCRQREQMNRGTYLARRSKFNSFNARWVRDDHYDYNVYAYRL